MGAATHILLINLTVLAVAAAGFAASWLRARDRRAGLWIAIGLGVLICGGLVGALSPLLPGFVTVLGANSLIAMGMICLALGVRAHYRFANRPVATLAWAIVSVALVSMAAILPRGSLSYMLALHMPLSIACAVVGFAALRSPSRDGLDTLLAVSIGAVGLQFLWRPIVMVAAGGLGASPAEFFDTTYALHVLTVQTVLSVLAVAALTMVHVRDTVRDLERASESDPMTGLLNRRGLDAAAPTVLSGKARSFRPASVVVTDIDRFKSVNDTYGHDAGDRVIRALAGLLEGTAREGDVVARMGGEEFVVVMTDASPELARLYAEAVRVALAEIEHDALEGERITASFGIAELMPTGSLSEAIAEADMALYEAKRAGRNRVRVARPRPAPVAWAGVERRAG